MRLSTSLFRALLPLIPLCVLSLAYIYLYPFFHGCAFPTPERDGHTQSASTWFLGPFGHQQKAAHASARVPDAAPLRLLALGDPQLEGDSSLPDLNRDGKGALPSLFPLKTYKLRYWNTRMVLQAAKELFLEDLPRLVEYGQKWLDLLGNDFYLAHLYRTVHAWTDPTHIVVLGDLLGSQWISDDEFERRADRFWRRVFKGARPLPATFSDNREIEALSEAEILERAALSGGEWLKEDLSAWLPWNERIISVAGNHDIGYAGDIDKDRIARFERRFGPVNRVLQFARQPTGRLSPFQAPLSDLLFDEVPTLRLVNLNSMNLDTPARSADLQGQTYDFLNEAITGSRPLRENSSYGNDATILLTHIPLHKPFSVCADAPFFDFVSEDYGSGVKEQNHLSEHVSREGILQGLFGMKGNQATGNQGFGRNGIILTGHDHVGCDVWHYWNASSEHEDGGHWTAARYHSDVVQGERAYHERWTTSGKDDSQDKGQPGIREITVRSMMGEFGGNAGLLSAWFDEEVQQWRFEYASCALGVQHIWWAIHILALVTMGATIAAFATVAFEIAFESDTLAQESRKIVEAAEKEAHHQKQKTASEAKTEEIDRPATPKQETAQPATSSLSRSDSKRLASDVMKQRREKYQRSLRGCKDVDASPGLSKRTSTASFRPAVDREWDVVDADSPG